MRWKPMISCWILFIMFFAMACPCGLSQEKPNKVEPTQESLDAAIGGVTTLTIRHGDTCKLLYETARPEEIKVVIDLLRIKLNRLESPHFHADWIFLFSSRDKPTTVLNVDPGYLEWSEWDYRAQLAFPQKLDAWLRSIQKSKKAPPHPNEEIQKGGRSVIR